MPTHVLTHSIELYITEEEEQALAASRAEMNFKTNEGMIFAAMAILETAFENYRAGRDSILTRDEFLRLFP